MRTQIIQKTDFNFLTTYSFPLPKNPQTTLLKLSSISQNATSVDISYWCHKNKKWQKIFFEKGIKKNTFKFSDYVFIYIAT